jgi:hypothetical protein
MIEVSSCTYFLVWLLQLLHRVGVSREETDIVPYLITEENSESGFPDELYESQSQ